MEQIYTVKVRCEPCRNQAYPSERAYSSSTVGGLASLHLILGLFGGFLLLPAITSSAKLAISCSSLILGGLSAFVTGMLASKLWYVERYIKWFLLASSISVATSAISTVLVTVFVLKPSWRLFLSHLEENVPGVLKQELFFHIFLAMFIEFLISLQSVRIAAEGVKNTRAMLQSSPSHTIDRQNEKPCEAKPPNYYADVVKELCKLQKNAFLSDGGELGRNIVSSLYAVNEQQQRLPRPETQKEYKERMENFLSYNESNSTKD